MQFLYAIEGVSAVNAAKLTECGLDKVLREPSRVMQSPSAVPCEEGDAAGAAGAGCIFASGRDDTRLRYDPDKQRWEKSITGKGGGYWIGYWLDAKPTAAELARDNQIDGHRIAVEGDDWLVPCARVFPEGTRMPRAMALGADGKVYGQVMSKYRAFCKQAEVLWDDLYRLIGWMEGDEVLDAAAKFQMVVDALGFNYFIGVDELNALEILTTDNIERFLWAIVDGAALVEHVEECKKKVLEEMAASTGSRSESRSGATAEATVVGT